MHDLTIVLVLWDRGNYYNYYTRRWMSFAAKYLDKFNIIIADGSGLEEIENYFKNDLSIKKLNFRYIKYPKDQTYSDYFAKLSDSINKVETKYIILADDDDFYSFQGIEKSVEFLENNDDYVTCRGIIGEFRLTDNLELSSFYVPKQPSNSLIDNKAFDRYFSKLFAGSSTVYDVHLTEFQKKSHMILHENNFIEPIMVEMIPESLDVIEGKIGRINEIYLMRQHGNNNSHHAKYVEKKGGILNRLAFGDFSHDLKIWANIISKELAQKDNISIKKSYEYITDLFIRKLQEDFEKVNLKNNNFDFRYSIKNYIKRNLLPTFITKKLSSDKKNRELQNLINNNKFINDINNHLIDFK